MGEKTGHIIWNKLDRLDVTPTEALVLLALAHFGIDDLPLCHPRQRHICRKTHLSMTAVKTSLAALKKKGSSCMTVGGFPLHKFAWPLFYGLLSRSSGPRNFD